MVVLKRIGRYNIIATHSSISIASTQLSPSSEYSLRLQQRSSQKTTQEISLFTTLRRDFLIYKEYLNGEESIGFK